MSRLLGCLLLCSAGLHAQVPFLRGDANDDGRRSIADAHYISLWLHGRGSQPPCVKAADANDDGLIRTSGVGGVKGNDVRAIAVSISCGDLEHGDGCGSHDDVAEPRDFPGDDPTPDGLPCDAYTGAAQPVDDPQARLELLEVTCPGGQSSLAVLKLRLSHSRPIGGYWGVLDGQGLFAGALRTVSVAEGHGSGDPGYAVVQGGQVHFAYLDDASAAGKLPPESGVIALKLYFRLEPGTRAGAYPLVLLDGEMADSITGQAIFPALLDGVLTVEEDVATGATADLNIGGIWQCEARETLPPSGPEDVQVAFHVGLVPGEKGAVVTVPMWIEANVPIEGFSFALTYRRDAMRLVRVAPRPRAGQTWESFRFDSTHRSDSQQTVDDVWGEAVVSSTDAGAFLAPRELHHVLDFEFDVDSAVPDGLIDLRLTTLQASSDLPDRVDWRTAVRAYGQWLDPGQVTCFETLRNGDNGVIIGQGVVPFLRGDANADGAISLGDAVQIARLFRQGSKLACDDAGDVNDDGGRNFGDAIHILKHLFEDASPGTTIPPPFPGEGQDETLDPLPCEDYRVLPAPQTDDLIRVGSIEAAPGESVEVPIFATTSLPLDSFVLVAHYDPLSISLVDQLREALKLDSGVFDAFRDFEGAFFNVLRTDLVPGHAVIVVVPDIFHPPAAFPAQDVLVGRFTAHVSANLQPGDELTIQPVAFAADDPARPDRPRTEIVVDEDGKPVTRLPRLGPGVIRIVDPSEPTFLRGDANADLTVNISDPIFTLAYLFLGGPGPPCEDAADADDSGKLELTDAIVTLGFLFGGVGARPLPPPYPERGRDGEADALGPCQAVGE